MKFRNDVTVTYNKDRKRWLVRWPGKYDPETEKQPRYCKSFKNKNKAKRFAETLKQDREDGLSLEPKTLNLGNLCKKVLESRQSSVRPTTLKTYSNTADRLINYFGSHRNIKTISMEEAEAFLSDVTLLEDGSAPSDSTRTKQLRNSRMFFNKAIDWGYIRVNPFRKISLGKIKKENWHCITPAEFNRLIKVIDNIKVRKNKKGKITEKQDIHNKAMLKAFYIVMYDCGLRFGEAINLLWTNGNVDLINKKILIQNRSSKNGLPSFNIKDHEARSIPCTKRAIESLETLKEMSNITNNPYVFLSDGRYEIVKAKWQGLVSRGDEDKWRNDMMVLNTNRKFKTYCDKAGIIM